MRVLCVIAYCSMAAGGCIDIDALVDDPETVARFDGSAESLLVDDQSVYWLDERSRIWRTASNGTGTSELLADFGDGSPPVSSVKIGSEYLYAQAASAGTASIFSVAKRGGTPHLVAEINGPTYETVFPYAAHGEYVYWVRQEPSCAVTRVAGPGGPEEVVCGFQHAANVRGLRVDDAAVVWVDTAERVERHDCDGVSQRWCNSTEMCEWTGTECIPLAPIHEGPGIYLLTNADGAPPVRLVELRSTDWHETTLLLADDRVYYSLWTSDDLRYVTRDGQQEGTVPLQEAATWVWGSPVLGGDHLYWGTGGQPSPDRGQVRRARIATGDVETVLAWQFLPTDVALDETHLYCLTYESIVRVALADLPP